MSSHDGARNHVDTQSSLTQQLATRLIQGDQQTPQTPMKACIAIAGGGSNSAAAIASVPGASSLLLESIVTYDRRSFADFVTQNAVLEGGDKSQNKWLSDLESLEGVRFVRSFSRSSSAGDGNSSAAINAADDQSSNTSDDDTFHFCSAQAAILLSKSALHRSMQLSPSFQDKCLHCIGVGSTSSLVGKLTNNDGDEASERRRKRKSRVYVACTTLRDGTLLWEVELSSAENDAVVDSSHDSAQFQSRRTRAEEEAVVSNLVLLALIHRKRSQDNNPSNNIADDTVLDKILNRIGDTLNEKWFGNHEFTDAPTQSPATGARKIVNGDASIVAVLPSRDQMQSLYADSEIPLSADTLIVPGSFNPPHSGHVALANAAVSALRRLRQVELRPILGGGDSSDGYTTPLNNYSRYSSLASFSSTSSSNVLQTMWSTVDRREEDQNAPTVLFEMSVTNADKPPIDPAEVERRINLFLKLPESEMPKDWGVLLTNAPLFSKKASVLNSVIKDEATLGTRKMTFVIGTDTMVRIINPKYYDNCKENMIAALIEMQQKGVHFIVGGRLEQRQDDGPKTFVSGEEEINELPQHVQQMFTLLGEDDFRVDISSTELRKEMDYEAKLNL